MNRKFISKFLIAQKKYTKSDKNRAKGQISQTCDTSMPGASPATTALASRPHRAAIAIPHTTRTIIGQKQAKKATKTAKPN